MIFEVVFQPEPGASRGPFSVAPSTRIRFLQAVPLAHAGGSRLRGPGDLLIADGPAAWSRIPGWSDSLTRETHPLLADPDYTVYESFMNRTPASRPGSPSSVASTPVRYGGLKDQSSRISPELCPAPRSGLPHIRSRSAPTASGLAIRAQRGGEHADAGSLPRRPVQGAWSNGTPARDVRPCVTSRAEYPDPERRPPQSAHSTRSTRRLCARQSSFKTMTERDGPLGTTWSVRAALAGS